MGWEGEGGGGGGVRTMMTSSGGGGSGLNGTVVVLVKTEGTFR